MPEILNNLITTLRKGQPAILCTIVNHSGSTPRKSGTHMLFLSGGESIGSVGGGPVEKSCQLRAKDLFKGSATYAEVNIDIHSDTTATSGMICGGNVSVLLQKILPDQSKFFQQVKEKCIQGKKPILLTFLPQEGNPPAMYLLNQENLPSATTIRHKLDQAECELPSIIESEGRQIFAEQFIHPGTVHLVGGGHVSQATARIASLVGFEVTVMDNRKEFADPSLFPEAQQVHHMGSYADCLSILGSCDYLIIVTHSHAHDRDVLKQALASKAGYIGMIGSRRKRDAIFTALRGEGITDLDLSRVHCPIGLSIGAKTPEEIAVSIVAQLIQVRSASCN